MFEDCCRASGSGLRRASAAIAAALAVSVLVLAGCGESETPSGDSQGAAASEPVEITVGVAGGLNNAIYWDTMVAQSKGFFTKHGLNPKLLDTKDGPGTVQALASGSVPIGVGATDSMMNGIDRGAEITMVGAVSYANQAIVATKDIKSYSDLKGKKIVSGATNAGSGLLLTYMLEHNGIDPKNDVTFVLSGSTAQRIAALTGGGASATILNPPAIQQAIDSGFHVLQFSGDVIEYLFIAVGVNQGWAAKNGPTVTKFLQALEEAHTWLRDPANQQEAEKILATTLKTTAPVATTTYENAIRDLKIFPPTMAITPEIVNNAFKVLGKPASDPEKYIDTSYAGSAG